MTTEQKFFYDNAGYSYGAGESREQGKLRGALELAHAEECARARGWRYEWLSDDDADLSFVEDWSREERKEWSRTEHEVLGCVLKDAEGKVLASLWGIVDATREYGRMVEAELAAEALSGEKEPAEELTLS